VAAPGPARAITTPSGRVIDARRPTVTYVSRSLEPYRGFHTFMRALPQILRQNPTVEVMIVGKDEVSYGRPPGEGGSWREVMLREVGRDLDLSRVHFLGTLPYAELINLFRLSTVHVYLTYPFVLSWSLLEAMASGCAVVGSSTGPVMEVIEDGLNGVLTNFFDERELTAHVSGLLRDPQARQRLAAEARRTVAEKYDFRKVALPAYEQLIDTLIDE
jgi:glycosyltransferase involved in cell wall biosynthesis